MSAGAHNNPGQDLPGFDRFFFSAADMAHWVYCKGESHHPPLLVMSELAGFAPGLLLFVDRLVAAGFRVYVPWLFGPFGKRAPLRNVVRLCISREFGYLRAGKSAPIATWLRALSAQISQQNGGVNIGAIGMCLTGAFAIPLIIDPHVPAAVAAQPSVPMSWRHLFWGSDASMKLRQLNVDAADIAAARQRLDAGEAHLFACRFRADRICPAHKLDRLRTEFPVGLIVKEYAEVNWHNARGQRPHATYTKEYRLAPDVDAEHPSRQAFADLVAFFRKHLVTNG